MVLECDSSLTPAFVKKPSLLSFYVVQGVFLSLFLLCFPLFSRHSPGLTRNPSLGPFFLAAGGAQDHLHSRNLWDQSIGSMELDGKTRQHLTILALYLNQAEARDKICRTIQYGSKFLAGGTVGVAQQVALTTGLARKVFRLLKSVNELEGLMNPSSDAKPVVLLGKSKHALMATYLALDNLVWAGWTGIYKNMEHTQVLSNISLYFFMGGCACSALSELYQLITKEKDERHLIPTDKMDPRYAHALSFAKSSMDVIVAIGLLQLAPKRVTPRVTGLLGTVTSLITCYELFKATRIKHKIT